MRRLEARRREVDERFDPDKALKGAGRYLSTALDSLGREDLAVVSYHMGIGNLQNVLAAYGDEQASYTRVYFDRRPTATRAATACSATSGTTRRPTSGGCSPRSG